MDSNTFKQEITKYRSCIVIYMLNKPSELETKLVNSGMNQKIIPFVLSHVSHNLNNNIAPFSGIYKRATQEESVKSA